MSSKTEKLKQACAYAWHGSGKRWDSAWLQLAGGAVGGVVLYFSGVRVPPEILDNPALSGVAAIVIGAVVGALLTFVLRLLWWPFHERFKVHGGLRLFLRARLGRQMWPVVLMASGFAAFVILSGSGFVAFMFQLAHPGNAAPASQIPAQPAPIIKKNYFPPEKAELGTLLSNIAARLNDEGLKSQRDGQRLGNDLPQSKEQLQATLDIIDEARSLSTSMSRSIWDDIIYKNPRFDADLRQIVGDNMANSPLGKFQVALNTFQQHLYWFVSRFDNLDEKDRSWIPELMKQDRQSVYDASNVFFSWIQQTNRRIDDMREQLR